MAEPGVLVEYTDADGDTLTFTPREAALHEELFKQSRAEVEVPTDEWGLLRPRLDKQNDEWRVLVDGVVEHAGRFVDADETTWGALVRIGDWEEDARDAEPTPAVHRFENSGDDEIATDAISRMPTLTAGTVENTTTITKLFNRASPAAMLRSLARATGAEIRYNADQTVDYEAELGEDKSGKASQLLSESEDTVAELNVVRDTREEPTHILVLGAGEGDAQVSATATHATFTAGEREVWRRFKDKEITSDSEAQELADNLMAEVEAAPSHLEVEATDVRLFPPPELGDTYTVEEPMRGLDETVRVIATTHDPIMDQVDVTLTNRPVTDAETQGGESRQLEQFTGGYEGLTVPVNDTPISRQPVADALDAIGHTFYPSDVRQELEALLLLEGLPYRAYSEGAASGGGPAETTSSSDTGEFINRLVQIYPVGEETSGDFVDVDVVGTPTGDFDGALLTIGWYNQTGGSVSYDWQIENTSTSTVLASGTVSVADGESRFENHAAGTGEVSVGDTIRFELTSGTIGTDSGTTFPLGFLAGLSQTKSQHEHTVQLDTHTHPADPGVVESFSGTQHFPEKVGLSVGGASVLSRDVVDDYEQDRLAEYSTIQLEDGQSGFELNTGDGAEGTSTSLEYDGGPDSTDEAIFASTSGLPAYPEKGGKPFEFSVKIPDLVGVFHIRGMWGVQSEATGEGYAAGLSPATNTADLQLVRHDGASAEVVLDTVDVGGVPENEWIRFEVDWASDGSMTVTAFREDGSQLAELTATDDTYGTGGAAMWGQANGIDAGLMDEYALDNRLDGGEAFQEQVEILGDLSEGFNEIRVTSESLGHVRASLFLDLFRQVTSSE